MGPLRAASVCVAVGVLLRPISVLAAPPSLETPVGPAPLLDADDGDGEGEDGDDDGYDPRVDSPEARRAAARIRGGSILLGAGLVLGFGALGLGLSDPCATAAGNGCNATSRNRAALTLGLPGLAMLGTGIALLTVGLLQRKQLRVELDASRTGAMLGLSGRF